MCCTCAWRRALPSRRRWRIWKPPLPAAGSPPLTAVMMMRRNAAVGRSLQVSLDQLSKNEQSYYPQLAIFPDDVPIPLTALGRAVGP